MDLNIASRPTNLGGLYKGNSAIQLPLVGYADPLDP